nr:PREDICTED: pentatricopeptide repeat-containing protein At4g26800-like [Daucus carota subsp. sativus]
MMMMMMMMKKFVISNSAASAHNCLASFFSVIAVSHFSTNPNPNIPLKPKPQFPYSSNPSHARLQYLLLEKSKVGFDKLDDALQVFDKMLLMKPLPTVIDFNQLLAALVKMKHYSVAVSLFRKMRVESIAVDIFTFNTLINCFCHLNRVDFAFSLLAAIIKHGFVPDVFTYNTLIRGLISRICLMRLSFCSRTSSDFNPMLLPIQLSLTASAREGILLWLLSCSKIWRRKVASLIP